MIGFLVVCDQRHAPYIRTDLRTGKRGDYDAFAS